MPVMMNGVDISFAVIDGDFGLDRPRGVTPTVIDRPDAVALPDAGIAPRPHYFPSSSRYAGLLTARRSIRDPIVRYRRRRRVIARAGRASPAPDRSPNIRTCRCRPLSGTAAGRTGIRGPRARRMAASVAVSGLLRMVRAVEWKLVSAVRASRSPWRSGSCVVHQVSRQTALRFVIVRLRVGGSL